MILTCVEGADEISEYVIRAPWFVLLDWDCSSKAHSLTSDVFVLPKSSFLKILSIVLPFSGRILRCLSIVDAKGS